MNQKNQIAVCVCTFRRPQLIDTLNSLKALQIPDGYAVSILVVDNDHEPSAQDMVQNAAAQSPVPIRYLHCPAGNISLARNCALENGNSQYLAFIDDDEIATKAWLANLVTAAQAENFDVVLGPVQAIYADDAPQWMRKSDIHSTDPVWVSGKIKTGYSCNVLIDQHSLAVDGLQFDLQLGQSGGEDTKFFSQVSQRGGTIGYAQNALITEAVPHSRASFGWLLKRKFRMGQTHAKLLSEERAGLAHRLMAAIIALSKAAYCFVLAVGNAFFPTRRNGAILRGALHVGVISGLFGVAHMRLYGPGQPS